MSCGFSHKVKCSHAIALQSMPGLFEAGSTADIKSVAEKIAHIISVDPDGCRHPSGWDGADPEYSAILIECFNALDQSADLLPGGEKDKKESDDALLNTATECSNVVKAGFNVL